MRVAGHLLAPYLTYLFTLRFDIGIFPIILRIAAVTTIHKTYSATTTSNYRPISVLPCLFKILEKLIQTDPHPFWKNTAFYIQSNTDFVQSIH